MDNKLLDPELLSEAWKELGGQSDQQEVTGPRVVPCHSFTSRRTRNPIIRLHESGDTPKSSSQPGEGPGGLLKTYVLAAPEKLSLQTTVAADRCHRSHRRRRRLAQRWNYLAQG